MGTIRVHCEARDPCHAPQISHPIPRAERFLPTCVHHRHIPSCVCQAREIANASHIETRMSITHRHEWRINLGCSDTLPAHHHGHHTFRMWWASSVASLSHSNRLSNFDRVPPVTLSGGIDHEWRPAVLHPMQILTIAHAAQLLVVWHVACVCVCECVCMCVCVCVSVCV